eukprot:TRINITY_DN11915_c0_g1_i3.p1 TRINITY_DN11915_c0_g1~~TRINITY_DN11915_c0_g1_i3.p1  ORF type:complete len:251 (-),score=64.13 TRINITY_DN11915_c0_g1_i3:388-1140(-)
MLTAKEITSPIDLPSSRTFPCYLGLRCTYLTKSFKKPLTKCFDKELDVLCVNCMRLVPSSQVALHSLHCVHVNSEVKLMDCSPEIQAIDYKLQQLKAALERLVRDRCLLAHRESNEYYLKIMREYASDLIQIAEYTKGETVRCAEMILNIMSLNRDFNGSPCIKIYIERLLVLAKEKNVQLFNYYKEIMSEEPIERTMDELLQEKHLKIVQLRKSKELIRSSAESRHGTNYINNPNQPVVEAVSDPGCDE